jgi:hypothetical protein
LAALLDLDGVTDAVEQSRAAVDAMLADRSLRRRSADVSAESSIRGAWASAWLAGARVSLDELRAGVDTAIADPVVQGALRAQGAIGSLADTWSRAPRQALARLHALAAADLVADPGELGRPRTDTSVRLDTLASVLSVTSVPAVVVAAVVHGELLSLDAFAPVSGLVARAAARLTLVERGLDPKSLVVLEVGHREYADEYAEALEAYRGGTTAGLADWIRHCAVAVQAGAQEARAISEALARS